MNIPHKTNICINPQTKKTMAGNPDKRIFDAIDRHFAGGLPMTQQTLMTKNAQRRVAICWKLFQMWKDNPMMDVMSCLLYTFGRTMAQAYSDMKVFKYIQEKHMDTTRQTAFRKSSRTAELIIERAMAKDDLKAALDGLAKFNDVNRLKEPAPAENPEVMVAALPLVLTTDVKEISKESENINEEAMKRLYRKYGGEPDRLMDIYYRKKQEIRENPNSISESTPEEREEEEQQENML